MVRRPHRAAFALGCVVLGVAGAAALLTSLGRAPLFLWDESMYCRATAEMAHGASWLYATADGAFDPIYGKPPLVNWLQLASTTVLGWSVATLRLPTALGMLANVVLIALTGRLLGGKRLGLVAGALVLLSPRMLHTGRHIVLEDVLAPLFAAAILAYAWALRGQRRWLMLPLAAGTTAAALLTKQAFALLLPAAIVIAELVPRAPGWLRRVVVYGLLALVPAALWFAVAYNHIGSDFVRSMVGYHVASRFTSVLEGHPRGLNAYAAAIADYLEVLPWPIALVGWLSLWRTRDAGARFVFLAWTVLVTAEYLVAGVAAKTFLPWYQVVVMALFFIGAARALLWLWHRHGWARLAAIAIVAATIATSARVDAIAVVIIALVACVLARKSIDRRLRYAATAIATGAAAIVIANPLAGGDGRTAITDQLGRERTVVVGGEWLRVWACYAPDAARVRFTSCADLTTMGATNVILEGSARDCALPGCSVVYEGLAREDGRTTTTSLLRCGATL